MTPAGNDFTLCPTGRGLAASRRPFGDARSPRAARRGGGTPALSSSDTIEERSVNF